MRVVVVLCVLGLLFLSFAQAYTPCWKFTSCDTCVLSADNGTGVFQQCEWCASTQKCAERGWDQSGCRSSSPNLMTTTDQCAGITGDFQNNGIVRILFIIIYVVLAVGVFSIYYARRKYMTKIAAVHQTRTGIMDYSAFPDADAICAQIPPNVLWSDVSLRVPTIVQFVLINLSCLVGVIWVSAAPWVPFLPVFLFFVLPPAVYIANGLMLLLGNRHYSDIYWLTTDGVYIRSGSILGKKTNILYSYDDMKELSTDTTSCGTGNVCFGCKTVYEAGMNGNFDETKKNEPKKDLHAKFANIVRAQEVLTILKNYYNYSKAAPTDEPPAVVYGEPQVPVKIMYQQQPQAPLPQPQQYNQPEYFQQQHQPQYPLLHANQPYFQPQQEQEQQQTQQTQLNFNVAEETENDEKEHSETDKLL